ncbi:MAG: GGDEF domain-containing protein [Mesorhizobium sp.]
MSGAGFILAINLFVAGLISAAFMMVAVFDRGRVAARWLAFAYAAGTGFFAIEAAIPMLANARLAVVAAAMSMLVGMAAFNVGLARKYDRKVPRLALCAILLVSVVVLYAIQDLPRQSPTRMFAYQTPFALMQLVGASIVLSARDRRGLDNLLVGLLAASAVQFLSKPLLAGAFGGWGDRPQDYIGSTYALISQTMATVFALAIALLVMVILVRDVLADATRRSETDTLSGLLNRRGFEERADRAVREAVRREGPLALVIADLDHFKSINDSYGHAAGDAVIAAFARFVADATTGDGVAGRIGGEEFAIVLPATNIVAARLFAEGARSAFAALPVDGLPDDVRFTASFGVAELAPGETTRDLMRRADGALYEAKKAGRDCVRVSLAAGRLRPLTRAG